MIVYTVQCQHTAGAYKTIKICRLKRDAVKKMAELAKQEGVPYDGSDKFTNGGSTHHCNRYRIIKEKIYA